MDGRRRCAERRFIRREERAIAKQVRETEREIRLNLRAQRAANNGRYHAAERLQRMSDRAHDRAVACEVRGKMYHNAREEIFLKRNQPAVNSTTTNFDPPQVVDHPATFVPTAPDALPMTAYPPYPPPPYSEKP